MWPLLAKTARLLPAEAAHKAAVQALRFGIAPRPSLPSLPVQLAGLQFDNPLGLAAGFDKNAEAMAGAFQLGFGHVEVGTITPLAQPGNPKPRVFRLSHDAAVINRYGFNSEGRDRALQRLTTYRKKGQAAGVLGINIGANKLSTDPAADYYDGAKSFAALADYLTVNISSPNTPGLRDLQDAMRLPEILGAVASGLADASEKTLMDYASSVPVFVKLAPDMEHQQLIAALDQLAEADIHGVILTNTTISRPDSLKSVHKQEIGGLSGKPLFRLASQTLSDAHKHLVKTGMRDKLAIIGVGGIGSAEDVYVKLLLGADTTQLYSALALQGPELPSQILTNLADMLANSGVSDVASICGQAATVDEAMMLVQHSAITG